MEISANNPGVAIVDQLSRASAEVTQRQDITGSGNVAPPEPVSPEQVVEAVSTISDYVQNFSRDLQFQVDDISGRTIVTVKDHETEEVVRQIPTEEVIAISRYIAEYGYDPVKGLLMNGQG